MHVSVAADAVLSIQYTSVVFSWHLRWLCSSEGFSNFISGFFCSVDMDDNLKSDDMPLLTIDIQSYGLGSGDVECYASSSNHTLETNGSFKIACGDDEDLNHASGSYNHDSWKGNNHDPSQVQPLGVGRSKRCNCRNFIPSQWNAQYNIPGNLDEGSSRLRNDFEHSLGRSSEPGFVSFTGRTNQGMMKPSSYTLPDSHDIYLTLAGPSNARAASETGNASEEDSQADWSRVSKLRPFAVRQADACLSRVKDASSSEGCSAGSMTNLSGNANSSLELQNFIDLKYNASHHGPLFTRTSMNFDSIIGEQYSGSGAALSSHPSLPSTPGKGEWPFSSEGFTAMHSSNTGRRGSYKRKSSPIGLTGSLSCTSRSSAMRESSSGRLISASGLDKADVADQICAATGVSHKNPACITQSWEVPQNHSGLSIDGEDDGMPEILIGNSETSSPLSSSVHEQFQRCNRSRPIIPQPEDNLSLLNASFVRSARRSIPNLQCQRWLGCVPSEEQPMESAGISSRSTSHQSNYGLASAANDRTASHSLTGSWISSHLLLNRNNHHTVASVAPNVPSLCEADHSRNLTAGLSQLGGTMVDNQSIIHMVSDSLNGSVTASTTRPWTSSDHRLRTYNTAASSTIHLGSAAPHLHFLSAASGSRNRIVSEENNILTTATASGSNIPMPGFATIYQGPSHSTRRQPLLFDSHVDSILVPHIHGLLSMPFRELHMLPARGENQNEAFSEELVMLDPSIAFGSIDILDQHSDMRLDVDNMSYEELLALEERIGNVGTGLNEEAIAKCSVRSNYLASDVSFSAGSQESEVKCCICQEEYVQDDELGRLQCSHTYHTPCIKQWLLQKNQCPICKTAAYSKS